MQLVGTVGAWVGWAVGALALAVPSACATLTVGRAVVPGGASSSPSSPLVGGRRRRIASLALGAPGPRRDRPGRRRPRPDGSYVQASAYGDEQRFPLRPPLGYLGADGRVVARCGSPPCIAAPLALGGAGVGSPAVAARRRGRRRRWLLPRRWHQLSRRWLVFVPAGLVVHDPVVLADTLMLHAPRSPDRPRRRPGPGAGAADLTGPTPGSGVEITLDEPRR